MEEQPFLTKEQINIIFQVVLYNANINYRPVPWELQELISNAAGNKSFKWAFYPTMALDSSLDFLYTDYLRTSYIVKDTEV